MIIRDLTSDKRGGRAHVTATVVWEDCDRPTHAVYFETDEAFADSLSCNPHAFLVSCIVPALHYGERRIALDAEICPELRQELRVAQTVLRHWYYDPDRPLVRIEARTRSSLSKEPKEERAGFFFSGGIDSFATLRANRLNFPLEHPRSVKDGLVAYGLELDSPEAFEHVWHLLSEVAKKVGITLIPVYTNVYLRFREEDARNHWDFWTYKFMGAALAAIAHAFTKRFSLVSIASSFDVPNLHAHSLNPLLNYSSGDLRIRHDGLAYSRFEKTKLVAEWDVALQNLRVCNVYDRYRSDQLNCGRCEKCVRTMLALTALRALKRTGAFATQELSADRVRKAVVAKNPYTASWYREIGGILRAEKRDDLASAIEQALAKRRDGRASLRSKIKQLDNRFLKGYLKRLISVARA